jgi:hypothetical protein
VQGRLRKELLSVTIDTVCAHCDHPIKIELNSEMKYQVDQEGANPLVFSPQIDWESFSKPDIIPDF